MPPQTFIPVARAGPGRGVPGRGGGRGVPAPGRDTAGGLRRLPDKGYFAEVDGKAPVVSPLARLKAPDPTSKAGRYAPEFVWNTDWAAGLEGAPGVKKESDRAPARPPAPPTGEQAPARGLALTRVADLNDMSLDLSAALLPLKKREEEEEEERARVAAATPSTSSSRYTPVEPKATQADARRWTRGGRFARAGPASPAATPVDAAAAAAEAEAAATAYEQLKSELQLTTIAVGAAGAVTSAALYGTDAGASFAAGAAGGALYLRLLNRSVDSAGGGGAPRLLIPLILVLGANRWNLMKAADVGVTAEFLPMLVGFFCYKAAVVARQGAVLLGGLRDAAARGDGNAPMDEF